MTILHRSGANDISPVAETWISLDGSLIGFASSHCSLIFLGGEISEGAVTDAKTVERLLDIFVTAAICKQSLWYHVPILTNLSLQHTAPLAGRELRWSALVARRLARTDETGSVRVPPSRVVLIKRVAKIKLSSQF